MQFYWRLLIVFVWLVYLICSGIYMFSKGFLLSRVSQRNVSKCDILSVVPQEEYYLDNSLAKEIFSNVNTSSNFCLPKKSKVIILLVDALKYDFGVYNTKTKTPLPYENKLTIFKELLEKKPANTRLLKFRADPPTTTLQRLKGITTGTLPTFIDIGSNFATPEINEDNIIDQVHANGFSTVFLGDSTWTDLYPKRFKRENSYLSFDIFDLDTVDNQIVKYLFNELQNPDWNLLIAHFVGIDHCGHKFGPLHPEMSRKLMEINEIIKSIINKIDNDTTLFVIGDHGMTATGDHGGDTDDEINALLFAYSPAYPFNSYDIEENNTMQQIDFVPTLSAILGIPTPYSNLGSIIFNIIPQVPVPYMKNYEVLLLHIWQNTKQMHNYLINYAFSNKKSFRLNEMEALENEFIILTHRVNSIYSEEAFKSVIKDIKKYLRQILYICRSIWVKFEPNQMMQGLVLVFTTIFFTFLLINNSKITDLPNIFNIDVILFICSTTILSGVFGYNYFKSIFAQNEIHGFILASSYCGIGILAFRTLRNWPHIAANSHKKKAYEYIPARLIFTISAVGLFSNSFIIHEQQILSHLLIVLMTILLIDATNEKFDLTNKLKFWSFMKSTNFILLIGFIISIILLRITHTFFLCREELGNCSDLTILNTIDLKQGTNSRLPLLTVLIMAFFITICRIYLKSCGNLTGFSLNILIARYGPTIATICASGHLILTNSTLKNVKQSHIDSLALIVYGLFIMQSIILLIKPLLIYFVPKNNKKLFIPSYKKVIPEIFKKMKKLYTENNENQNDNIPIIYGLATVYSSTLISFGVFLVIVLVILLGPIPSIGMFICIFAAFIQLLTRSISIYRTQRNLEAILQPNFTAIVSWVILSQFFFYATSHQSTLSQINWRAAFVGRSSNYDHSIIISAILVIWNTFNGQILMFTLFPLLITIPFSFYAIFPWLIRKKEKNLIIRKETEKLNINEFDTERGELTLYEYEPLFIGSLFKLACQLLMLQAIKTFAAMMVCTILCRHLMVWKIFAPRFIYESLATFVAFIGIILGYLMVVRTHFCVHRFIHEINKIK